VKYLFAVLILMVLLLGCEKETITPEPHYDYTWRKICEIPRSHLYFEPPNIYNYYPYYYYGFTASSYDDIWVCGGYLAFESAIDIRAYAAHYSNKQWQFYDTMISDSCIGEDIKIQPNTNNVWYSIFDDTDYSSDSASGMFIYDPSMPDLPFRRVGDFHYAGMIDFLDENNGVMIPERIYHAFWRFNGTEWIEQSIGFDNNGEYNDAVSLVNDPEFTVFIVQHYPDKFIWWSENQVGWYYIQQPTDVYMSDANNGFLVTDRGLLRKENGGDWYEAYFNTNFTGDAFSIDGIGEKAWILGQKNVFRWQNGQFIEEGIDPEIEDGRIQMLHNNSYPEQGLILSGHSLFARFPTE
jgi:hypothetical protein